MQAKAPTLVLPVLYCALSTHGSEFLGSRPIFPVSSVSGAGIDELRSHIETMTAVEKQDCGILRFPIDRAFSIDGFGTVVTGTVQSGIVKSGDSVELLPLKKKVRIRGIQSHGKHIKNAKIGGE